MLGAILALCLCAGPDAGLVPYPTAYAAALRGQPVLVVLTTEGCVPCHQILAELLPEARRRGWLEGVVVTTLDAESPYGKRLVAWANLGKQFPQTIAAVRRDGVLFRAKRVGFVTAAEVRELLAALRPKGS